MADARRGVVNGDDDRWQSLFDVVLRYFGPSSGEIVELIWKVLRTHDEDANGSLVLASLDEVVNHSPRAFVAMFLWLRGETLTDMAEAFDVHASTMMRRRDDGTSIFVRHFLRGLHASTATTCPQEWTMLIKLLTDRGLWP